VLPAGIGQEDNETITAGDDWFQAEIPGHGMGTGDFRVNFPANPQHTP
jgi:hypothetical protein